jgi:hypothetical protein
LEPRPLERALERRCALALFCACLLAYGYFVYRGPHHNPDSRLALTYAVVERGALDIDADAAGTLDRAVAGGHYYTDKAPGLSFLLVPLYGALRPLLPAALLGPEDRFVARYLLTFFGLGIPGALFAAFLFTWLGRIERRLAPRLAVAGAYALGSPVFPLTVSALGHVPAGMALFGAFAALTPEARSGVGTGAGTGAGALSGRRALLAGLMLGLAVAIEYPAALPGAVLVAYGLWRARPRRGVALRLLAGAAPPLLLLALYGQLVFGRPWGTGYAHLDPASVYAAGQAGGVLGVGWPRPDVALALAGGARRGLLVYAPWLLLAFPGAVLLWRRRRPETVAALGVLVALLAVNSGYAFWDGGASWGPRHLVPALPFLALLALPGAARWPRAALLLGAVSVLVTLAAVATRTLPEPDSSFPLGDLLLPRVGQGAVTNNWGQLAGLPAWRGLTPLLAAWLALGAWATGWRRSAGWLLAGLWALTAVATLHRAYLEYSEGYYLYLGARLAAGARLYAEAASTQPPLLPLLVSLLWRIAPDVYLPRLLAVALYVLAAVLAGRLAGRLAGGARAGVTGALATAIAALLPLGAGTVQVLDANGVLAPLGLAVALLAPRRPFLAGIVAAAGLSTKLTFLPLALAPLPALLLAPRRRPGRAYLAGLALAAALHLAGWLAVAGRPALDGLLGEMESPWLPLGAVLALFQLALLEGPVVLLAAWGWWRDRPERPSPPGGGRAVAWWCGLGAAVMPLFAVHQGTFVGVARPAEPFFAVYAALAAGALAARAGPAVARTALPAALAAALALPVWHDLRGLRSRPTVDPQLVLARLDAPDPGADPADVLAPPYYAALAGRRMVFDYADWTVWGMRTAAGVGRESDLTRRLLVAIEGGDLPVVLADFRLAYVPGVAEALERRYVRAAEDGDDPARSVAVFVPR